MTEEQPPYTAEELELYVHHFAIENTDGDVDEAREVLGINLDTNLHMLTAVVLSYLDTLGEETPTG